MPPSARLSTFSALTLLSIDFALSCHFVGFSSSMIWAGKPSTTHFDFSLQPYLHLYHYMLSIEFEPEKADFDGEMDALERDNRRHRLGRPRAPLLGHDSLSSPPLVSIPLVVPPTGDPTLPPYRRSSSALYSLSSVRWYLNCPNLRHISLLCCLLPSAPYYFNCR